MNISSPAPALDETEKLQRTRAVNRTLIATPRKIIGKQASAERRLHLRLRSYHLGAHAGMLYDATEDELAIATPAQLVTLAAMHAECGLISSAHATLLRALGQDPEVLRTQRYIGLIVAVSHLDDEIRRQHAGEIECARQFMENRGALRKLIADNSKTVAIVGNSPVEIGRKCGGEIDKCDIVIRFNDFSVEEFHSIDYGTKTDVWVFASNMKNLWRRDGQKFSVCQASGLSNFWRTPSGADFVVNASMSGNIVEEVPVRIYNEVIQGVGFHPSNGILTLRTCQWLRNGSKNLKVFGFSLTDQIDGAPLHYFDANHERLKNPPHKWTFEREYFEKLLAPILASNC